MQKWEYLFVHAINRNGNVQYPYQINGAYVKNPEKGETLYQYSNRLGDDGWELAGVTGNGGVMVFKRPIP